MLLEISFNVCDNMERGVRWLRLLGLMEGSPSGVKDHLKLLFKPAKGYIILNVKFTRLGSPCPACVVASKST